MVIVQALTLQARCPAAWRYPKKKKKEKTENQWVDVYFNMLSTVKQHKHMDAG